MQELLKTVQIKVNDKIYLKDPESSDIGKSMIKESIYMIHDIGLESFTFKKLADHLGTTESTIYRYFENKHKLLIYLISWYWGWLEYEIVLSTTNIVEATNKLRITIDTICDPLRDNIEHYYVSLKPLHEIVISESPKAYLTKDVDFENEHDFFANYKRINERLINCIREINPNFMYSKSLASIILESSIQQRFFALHFPNLTEIDKKGKDLGEVLFNVVINTIKNN